VLHKRYGDPLNLGSISPRILPTRSARVAALILVLALAACGRPAAAPTAAGMGTPDTSGAATAPPVNGISCDRAESVLFHIHAHLAIYANGEPQKVPYGVGIGQPWHVAQSAEGPFVDRGSCFYWLHTHTEDGIIHIESPVTRTFTLGDFFAIWGQPIGADAVAGAHGKVFAYVDGAPFEGDPAAIPLMDHEVIQLDVGVDAPPPQTYTFPTGL